MKHCDSFDRCPRSCNERGLCLARWPACEGRPTEARRPHHPFAPGVVQGYRVPLLGTAQQRRELRRLGAATLWWLAGCTAAAFALGWALGALA